MKIFDEYTLGDMTLKNKMVMAPMTRSRAIDNIPNDLMVTYYEQRANAGLIITEGVAPSPNGLGYPRIPGLYSEAQVSGWKKITDAVHAKGGKVAGYGVSVGTTALMPQFRLTQKIDMLFDDDPQRDGHLLGPDYEIPIYQGRDMMRHNPAVIIVFAWRYTDPIMKKQLEYIAAGGRFIVPLPDVRPHP